VAVVGLNSGGNFFDNHPLAGFSGIGDAVSCTFNIRKRRKRQASFIPNNVMMNLPTDPNLRQLVKKCALSVNQDSLAYFGTPHTQHTLAAMLEPCPCTIQQADADHARFRPFTQPKGTCYVSALPIDMRLGPITGTITLTQMCCYTNG
jgi:hypothetical protein